MSVRKWRCPLRSPSRASRATGPLFAVPGSLPASPSSSATASRGRGACPGIGRPGALIRHLDPFRIPQPIQGCNDARVVSVDRDGEGCGVARGFCFALALPGMLSVLASAPAPDGNAAKSRASWRLSRTIWSTASATMGAMWTMVQQTGRRRGLSSGRFYYVLTYTRGLRLLPELAVAGRAREQQRRGAASIQSAADLSPRSDPGYQRLPGAPSRGGGADTRPRRPGPEALADRSREPLKRARTGTASSAATPMIPTTSRRFASIAGDVDRHRLQRAPVP
jgi:hypothetical protein